MSAVKTCIYNSVKRFKGVLIHEIMLSLLKNLRILNGEATSGCRAVILTWPHLLIQFRENRAPNSSQNKLIPVAPLKRKKSMNRVQVSPLVPSVKWANKVEMKCASTLHTAGEQGVKTTLPFRLRTVTIAHHVCASCFCSACCKYPPFVYNRRRTGK